MRHYYAEDLTIKDSVLLQVDGKHIETIVGRVVFNALLPEKVRFINEKVTKKVLKRILDKIFDIYGREAMVDVADALKDRGFIYATHSAVTMNIFDLKIPEEKEELLNAAGEKVNIIHNHRFKGHLSDEEKHRLIITIRSDAKGEIEVLVKKSYAPGNDIYSLIDSGARGTR